MPDDLSLHDEDDLDRLDPPGSTIERFCPRCQRPAEEVEDGASALCRFCGDPLQVQGYCPVCERSWRLAPGADCPKHDIPLEEAPLDPPGHPAGNESIRWVTLRTFADDIAAESVRPRLEAEGIPTFVEGSRMGGRSMYLVATGGVKLQVPEPMLADARILLSQVWASPDSAEDLDDAWEELAPEPGSTRRRVMKGVILVVLLSPLILTLIRLLIEGLFRRIP